MEWPAQITEAEQRWDVNLDFLRCSSIFPLLPMLFSIHLPSSNCFPIDGTKSRNWAVRTKAWVAWLSLKRKERCSFFWDTRRGTEGKVEMQTWFVVGRRCVKESEFICSEWTVWKRFGIAQVAKQHDIKHRSTRHYMACIFLVSLHFCPSYQWFSLTWEILYAPIAICFIYYFIMFLCCNVLQAL